MRIQTFSIVVGTRACNAHCPFCVSKMTNPSGLEMRPTPPNWRNFDIACKLAVKSGVTTAMITGKGEPTLFPDLLSDYLSALSKHDIPLVELQTNGIHFEDERYVERNFGRWYRAGLSTVAVSMCSTNPEEDNKIYSPGRKPKCDKAEIIQRLHDAGFSVRLSIIPIKGMIDSVPSVVQLLDYAKENKVEQITLIPVNHPSDTESDGVRSWAHDHMVPQENLAGIDEYLKANGTVLMKLQHGASVYDVHGQNICMSNCLQKPSGSEEVRNLIFFPDGHLRYDWQYTGAIIL